MKQDVEAIARCETCRFGNRKVYTKPQPLPEPTSGSFLFGLVRWQKPTQRERVLYGLEMQLATETRPCMRYPEIRRVRLDHWCGEHQHLESAK